MRRARLLLTLVFVLATAPVHAQSIPAAVVAGSRLIWDQTAATLAEAQGYTYRFYKDALSGVLIAGVVCGPAVASSPAGTFPCEAPWPADVPGATHTAVVTAMNAGGLESPPSNPYTYVFTVRTIAPRNLRTK